MYREDLQWKPWEAWLRTLPQKARNCVLPMHVRLIVSSDIARKFTEPPVLKIKNLDTKHDHMYLRANDENQ